MKRHFVCALCWQETEATQTDMEAMFEFSQQVFPCAVDLSDCDLVCDRCYDGKPPIISYKDERDLT